MSAYSYDNTDIILLIGGIPMEGFGENKITLTRNNDVTTLVEGLESNIFASSSRTAGTLAFDLLYGTDYDLLMDNYSATKQLVPVSFIHTESYKTLITVGMVMTQPDIVLGDEPDSRTWTLVLDNTSLSVDEQTSELISGISYYTAT